MMTTGGSTQLRQYRVARLAMTRADAAKEAGISIGEAELIDKDDARDPPAAEAFEPLIGHNSQETIMAEPTEDKGSIAAQELRLFVERVERLEEEKKGIADDIRDVMLEMKGRGYDTKIVRKLLAIRKKKKGEHEEEVMLLETYANAIGMQLSLI
jgi:uncharacterized protein (UPF0335 family)